MNCRQQSWIVGIVFTCVASAPAQTFNEFLTRLNITSQDERPAIVDSFMNAVDSFPFIEGDTLCHFIYRGPANLATVAGDMTEWDPTVWNMFRVAGTEFWYRNALFEPDARLDYKYVLNGSNWILDPHNPHTIPGGFGPNSELKMPQYPPQPELNYYPEIPHGVLSDTMFASTNMGNSRRIRVYTPPDYNTEGDYPLILVHDGLEYISLAHMDRVLDYLIHEGRIEPLIAVFIPPVNRTPEYAGNLQDEFGQFITEEVLPWIESDYAVSEDPARRATLGASNGGNIALYLAVTYPEEFGRVVAQSSNVEENIRDAYENGPMLEQAFYLDMGLYDISILPGRVAALIDVFDERGYSYDYREFPEGHSWGNWRAHIDIALEQFVPLDVPDVPRRELTPMVVTLLPNYPNPFNPETTIQFEVVTPQIVSLIVYDVAGRLVDSLHAGWTVSGRYEYSFDGSNLPSGFYFYRLKWVDGSMTKKMLLLK